MTNALLPPSRMRRFFREDSASSMIEFSLSLTLLLTVVFGVMDTSRALYIDHTLANTAREGARYAMVRGNSFSGSCTTVATASCMATAANVTSYVKSVTPYGMVPANLTVTTTWPAVAPTGYACTSAVAVANSPGCEVKVKVTYAFNFLLPFLPHNTLLLTSTSILGIQR